MGRICDTLHHLMNIKSKIVCHPYLYVGQKNTLGWLGQTEHLNFDHFLLNLFLNDYSPSDSGGGLR